MPDDPIEPPPRQFYVPSAPDAPPPRESAFDRIIPTKNPCALIGYYVSVFSLIPCAGLILGPTAIVLGILGLNALKKQPQTPGLGHAWTAIILGTLTFAGNLYAVAQIAYNR